MNPDRINQSKPTKLIAISAPSGGGKTTLCQRLLKDFPNLVLSISSTTRPARGRERHGVDYFFINLKEFKRAIDEGTFAEWAIVHGHYYGTSKTVIQNALDRGQNVLLDIDVQGAANLKHSYPDNCVTLFIVPPDLQALEKRLRHRGTDSDETIRRRLENAAGELKEASRFDHVIVNDDIDQAYATLKNIVAAIIGTDKAGSSERRG